jgi:hypothetical protein
MSLVACWFVYWYVLSSGGELEKHGIWKLNCLKILVDKLVTVTIRMGQQADYSPIILCPFFHFSESGSYNFFACISVNLVADLSCAKIDTVGLFDCLDGQECRGLDFEAKLVGGPCYLLKYCSF